jgi:hypothetical protein
MPGAKVVAHMVPTKGRRRRGFCVRFLRVEALQTQLFLFLEYLSKGWTRDPSYGPIFFQTSVMPCGAFVHSPISYANIVGH